MFKKDILYLRLFRDKIEIKSLNTQVNIIHHPDNKYYNDRLLIADFETAEFEMRKAIKQLPNFGGRFSISPKLVFQPVDDRITEYSTVELRTFRDSSEFTGSSHVYLYLGDKILTDNEILQGIKNNSFVV